MSDKFELGIKLATSTLLVGMAAAIVAAIVEASWWFVLAIPLWIGLVLIWWDQIME